ncbi:WD40-repeat-containing domain protein [Mrakia frigida]|uniref:WD40 repeat domain-containing protein n=1 Tax=Mrakia frigida TaxID=29902 RepID=UPI003FCBFAB3
MATLLSYDSPFPIYGLSYTNSKHDPHRLALGSFVLGGAQNYLQVIGLKGDHQNPHLAPLATAPHPYPPTCVAWEPSPSSSSSRELLATTGDALRIFEYSPADGGGGNEGRIREKGVLCHTKALPTSTPSTSPGTTPGSSPGGQSPGGASGQLQNNPAPITSLSWNSLNPALVVTSSIDTTCTVWDVQASVAVTQLIAHDREVYDVAWLPGGTDVFVSVGEDGSLRAFDLRSLEHSTILYETPPIITNSSSNKSSPSNSNGALMRIAFDPSDAHYLATFHGNSGDVQVLDMRAPGLPVVELKGHGKVGGRVGAIGWGETNGKGGGGLCSGGNDSLLLLWDAASLVSSSSSSSPNPPGILPPNASSRPGSSSDGGASKNSSIPQKYDPAMAYTAPGEVDSVAWGVGGEWVGCAGGGAGGRGGWVRSLKV